MLVETVDPLFSVSGEDCERMDAQVDLEIPQQNVLDIDSIFDNVVGPFGIWQAVTMFVICICTPSAITFPVFVNAIPKLRCRMEEGIESLFSGLNFSTTASMIGPWSTEGSHDSRFGCNMYKMTFSPVEWSDFIQRAVSFTNNTQALERCPNGYIYEPYSYQYPDTIVKEWNLVCDDQWKGPFSTSMFMVGMMVGYTFGGTLGDRLGRAKTIYLATLVEALFGCAVSFANTYLQYTIFRSLFGMACAVKIAAICTLFVELTSAKYRSFFGAGWSIYVNCVSRGCHTLFAMYLHNWRHLHLLVSLPAFVGVFLLLFIPESPRWLIAKGESKKAAETLFFAHRVNKFRQTSLLTKENFFAAINYSEQPKKAATTHFNKKNLKLCCHRNQGSGSNPPCFSLCGTSRMTRLSLLSTAIFTFQVCTYFGILYYAQIVRDSIYRVTFFNTLTTIPAVFISTIAYNRFQNRKIPLLCVYSLASAFLLIGGLFIVMTQPTSELSIIITINLALVLLSSSFSMIIIFIPELFPILLRTQALGVALGLGRVGCMVCSFINELDMEVKHGLPIVIYGSLLGLQTALN